MKLLLSENIKIAFSSIRAQSLRATLTALIIAIGIMALVGILTAIDAIKSSINSNFTSMGANSFSIRNRSGGMHIGGRRPPKHKNIRFEEALRFKEEFQFPALVSVSSIASVTSRISYESAHTNPNIRTFGSDENYLFSSGYELESGRNFSWQEVHHGTPVVILGKDVEKTLFNKNVSALGSNVKIGGLKYKVFGVLKSKGNSMGFGGDKICIIPIQNARQYFSVKGGTSFNITVMATHPSMIETALGEAEGLFRKIRKIELGAENNFEITKSDNLANMLIENLQMVTLGATIIGFITLLGAAIGLMNIMLVSVTERTREIGVRKALGASQKTILNQFLIESVVICQLGGVAGILLGIAAGNALSIAMGIGFYVPWKWMSFGVILCVLVGLLSGFLPARRAARLDPIESLRFE